jgi:hypothetical protein
MSSTMVPVLWEQSTVLDFNLVHCVGFQHANQRKAVRGHHHWRVLEFTGKKDSTLKFPPTQG